MKLAVCIAGATRSMHREEVHKAFVHNLILPFCDGMCDHVGMFMILKNESFSRSVALRGKLHDAPPQDKVKRAIAYLKPRVNSIHVEEWSVLEYRSNCPLWKGKCTYQKNLVRAHVQSVVGQMHSWSWCSKRADHFDWLIITRPDVLFRTKMSSHKKWAMNVSMSDTDPRERVIVVQSTHIPDIARGWRRWNNCESLFPDTGCATKPEVILQKEANAIQVPFLDFGSPTFIREYNRSTFSEF